MEETLKQDNKSKSYKEFEKLLSEDLDKRVLKENEIVSGVVSNITKKHVFVDILAPSEGVIPVEEFTKEIDKIKIGTRIEVYLEKLESNFSGEVVISRQKALKHKTWKKMEECFLSKKTVSGHILSRVKGGFAIDLQGTLAFLPGSQVSLKPLNNNEINMLMKEEQTFEIVKMDKKRANIVLSRRSIMERARDKDKSKILSTINEGDVVNGTVKNITSWGVFVDLNGVDSLLHITDISWSRVNSPFELLNIGQQIKVLVTKIEKSTNKISVSVKHLTEDPYSKIINKYEVGQIYDGVVTKIQDYGVFVRLADGLEGLCHSSELSFLKRNVHPNKVLTTSQRIKVKLLEKDLTNRRLSLSYKQTQINPWKKFSDEHKIGDVCSGIIKGKTEYAIFATIENFELDCMIHKFDISYSPKDSDLDGYVKNQKIKFSLVEINPDDEKIRGSIRLLSKDPFAFLMDRNVGEILTVVVNNTTPNGIYVQAGKENLQMFIKKNQLSKDIVNCRPSRWNKKDKLDVLITELDKKDRTISVSIKALEEQQERENIKRFGVKDSGGVLGDLLSKAFKKKK